GTGRHVERDDRQLAALDFDVAALVVELRHAETAHDARGLPACVDSDTRVALAFGIVEEALVAGHLDVVIGELMEMSFGLLQADEVRLLFPQPLEETFARCGPNAAAVHRDDSHHAIIAGLKCAPSQSGRLMQDYQIRFIELAMARDALRFGAFKLKS